MKKNKLKVIIGLSCLPLVSLGVNASVETPSSTIEILAADPFFADSKVKVTLRNMWKYLKTDNGATDYKTIAQAWGQGLALDYQSGYFKDFIGADVSFYSGFKLAASDNFSSRAILYRNSKGDAEGYSKIGQRYVKLKFDADPVRFDVKGGWMIMKDKGSLTSSTRMSINSYQGWYGKITFDDLFADILYVTGTSRRDSPHKVRFTKANGEHINHVLTGGITYKTKDTMIAYFYGDAKDYVSQHGLETSFKVMPKLTLQAQVYGQIADDKNEMMRMSKRPFDDKAWHYAADVKWTEPDWNLKLGIAYTDAEKKGGVGFYSRGIIGNSRGRFNSTSYADIDYMRDDEIYFFADYNYKVNPDYSVGIRNMYGQLSYKGNDINSNAITVYNTWNPKSIKNLSIYADVGYGWHYKHNNNTPILDHKGNFQRSHALSGSMTLAYSFNLL